MLTGECKRLFVFLNQVFEVSPIGFHTGMQPSMPLSVTCCCRSWSHSNQASLKIACW